MGRNRFQTMSGCYTCRVCGKRTRETGHDESSCQLCAFQTEAGDDGFRVLCDGTNNTSAVIDNNELRVDVFVKPVRAAEFIRLQTIVTTTGATFEELVDRGAIF